MVFSFKPVCFDSLGAKSSCTYVKTNDVSILLEPGVSIMHKSFTGDENQKNIWLDNGLKEIKKAAKKSDILICSHYHYDHYFHDDFEIYENKTVFIKNPNEYINDEQQNRANQFFKNIYNIYNVNQTCQPLSKPKQNMYSNPLDDIKIAKNKDYGDYNIRKQQLFEKGLKWFNNRVEKWNNHFYLPEIKTENMKFLYPEEKTLNFKNTTIRCSKPLFHGIEFARVGWVFMTVISQNSQKLLHTSDLCGPMIEDYAEMIIKENPTYLIIDGPMTYMFGYLLNKINLKRCIENMVNIIKNIDAEIIIYDHHLTREKNFRKHTEKVWKAAEKVSKKVITAAEYIGKSTIVETYNN
jgi:predicted metallo-beta-lactamase superfamily hydrolase